MTPLAVPPGTVDTPHRLAVSAAAPGSAVRAAGLARELGLPLLPPQADARRCSTSRALLLVGASRLALQLTGPGAPGPVGVDFGAAGMRHRRSAGHNELLGRAVGLGRKPELRVLDATAGLGRDAFVLADLGARVDLCERNAVACALLRSGLEEARLGDDAWLAEVAARMRLHPGDAREQASELSAGADVIYLDPMFPERAKQAAAKKEMALFQFLLEDEPRDEGDLLRWALSRPVARVVVKRALKAPVLGEAPPSHSLRGKSVRYDVHVLSALG